MRIKKYVHIKHISASHMVSFSASTFKMFLDDHEVMINKFTILISIYL